MKHVKKDVGVEISERGEVLVAILNNQLDFAILREQGWYRIPVSSVEKWLKERWPPRWLAFYQTKAFGEEAHAVHYYCKVQQIRKVQRWQLFPDDPRNEKSERWYYQLLLQPLQKLPKPIYSRRWRRIVFIPTTWEKFVAAEEVNDLYQVSSLEERMWAELKRLQVWAERQEFVQINARHYFLDFAIYCIKGNIDIETDGDHWHANPERAAQDNVRQNDLETNGWKILRFSSLQIQEQIQEYCVGMIVDNVEKLGGPETGRLIPRKIDPDNEEIYQLSLFDDL
jgi:very-short-patch-repair endonuclease